MPPYKHDNKTRSLFNTELRKRLGDSVFDLAAMQATRPDGSKVSFNSGDAIYELMNPDYTDDGGHLNAIGRQVVAIEVLCSCLTRSKDEILLNEPAGVTLSIGSCHFTVRRIQLERNIN